MNILWWGYKLPIARPFVLLFDPNSIRKSIGFNLSAKEIKLRDTRWNLVVNPRDHIGFHSYIRNEPFEMSVFNLSERLKSTTRKVIIDIGANIGTASVPICSKYNYELIAVEPSKGNSALLSKNIINNSVKAKLFLVALVDKINDGYVSLYINNGNTGANSLLKTWNPSKKTTKPLMIELVPCKTFDELVKETRLNVQNVVVCKIDVEGMEEAVLRGANDYLTQNTAPIILEYRNDQVKRFIGGDMSGVVNILTKFHYKLYALDKDGGLLKFVETSSYENIVALKEGSELTKLLLQTK